MFSTVIRITTMLLLFSYSNARTTSPSSLSPELQKQYDEFQKDYEQALHISDDKTKFLKEFSHIEKKLKGQYKQFDKKEGKQFSDAGNQMALDIEMLEPLRIIAEGNASKESCSNAKFINDLNNQSDAKTYEKIKIQIGKLCK